MANWFRHLRSVELLAVAVVLLTCSPLTGSRSLGGEPRPSESSSSEGTVPFTPETSTLIKLSPLSSPANEGEDDEGSDETSENQVLEALDGSGEASPCAFMAPMSATERIRPYELYPLINLSHPTFDVSHGIVSDMMYLVSLQVPSESRFTLDYWVGGVHDDKMHTKRRHQRDRDLFELFISGLSDSKSVPESKSIVYCSKNSISGTNKDKSPLLLSLNWFTHPITVALSSEKADNPRVVFRLRFFQIAQGTVPVPVYEQTTSAIVRPDCYLVMKIREPTRLTLDSLWNLQSPVENNGLNCTMHLLPKSGDFGLEVRLDALSIYGMRDICKGRYIAFSRAIPTTTPSLNSPYNAKAEDQGEFPSVPYQHFPLDQKVCGKLEDYSVDERFLTFLPGKGSNSQLSEVISKEERRNNSIDDKLELLDGLLVKVSLPQSVKGREAFSLQVSAVSPCEKVVLRDLSGGIDYSKTDSSEECSIVIHVPYGNRIITRMALSKSSNASSDETGSDPEEDGDYEALISNSSQVFTNSNISHSNVNNINFSRNLDQSEHTFTSSDEGFQHQPNMHGCPESLETNSSSDLDLQNTHKFMVIKAKDIDSGAEFKWCFDSELESQAQPKRAWKSSGNKVKITFKLKHFDLFRLTYQSVEVEQVVKGCGPGWASLNGRCVVLLETLSSWASAEEKCQMMRGGHLATIEDEQDEFIIYKIITESALFHPNQAYWIGANDRDAEGKFQWTSGLPFSYTNWFAGWAQKRSDSFKAQPNDDGWSGQDCVEIRQVLNPALTYSGRPLSSQFWGDEKWPQPPQDKSHGSGNHLSNQGWPRSRLYWNDRNCEAKNFFICERLAEKRDFGHDYECNRTLQLSPNQANVLTVTSPAYPASYPDNIVCLTMIETLPGYRIVMSFDEFVLEESPSCQYDALEITEIHHDTDHKNDTHSNRTRRVCGDWTKRLKLLRYRTVSSSSSLSLKFESDFSHHFTGFKANLWAEKDVSGQCSDQQMKKFQSHCYLVVSYPAVNWATAQQICHSLQGKLASVISIEEWRFLSQTLYSTSRFDKKSTFWIGGSIDRNNNLVWSDGMPFNYSVIRSSDLQIISQWKCLRIYSTDGSQAGLAWRLGDCNELSGYVCKTKITEGEIRVAVNKSFQGTGGTQYSPNFPSNYPNNVDYRYHLVAPRGTKIVLQMAHIDIEDQEDCFYDYVEIIDSAGGNSSRYCGTYTTQELKRLDYVSSSNEVDIHFHSDFSNSGTGFNIVWRAVDVAGCATGKTLLAGLGGTGFSIQDAMVHSPNFPHFNLPNLDCLFTIVAPAGQRIWLTFPILELGSSISLENNDCLNQDHIEVDLLGGGEESDGQDDPSPVTLCGNLTSSTHRTSFLSSQEKIRIRMISPQGRTGRGFLGRFRAVSSQLEETIRVAIPPNITTPLSSINYPMNPPADANLTLALSSPPNYLLVLNINGTFHCKRPALSFLEIRDPYHGTNGTTWRLCRMTDARDPERKLRNGLNLVSRNGDDIKVEHNEISQRITHMNTVISIRSTFNRLDVRQVYSKDFHGNAWSAEIKTPLDENFRAKVLADGDRLLRLDGCMNSPCANGGSCVSENGKHICRCTAPFTGPFCGLSLCDLNPCLFGDCILEEKSIKCVCQLGYGGDRCDRRMKPCDDNPCSGHGACIEVNKTSYKCMCHAWWEGPRCESRMLVIPFKPLSQRVLEEPFWLGLITVSAVLAVIGLIWCLKRHFPEKLEKLLNDDLDKNRGISWVSSGRSPSFRAGGGASLAVRDPIPATSNVSGAPVSPHTYENRTFSLDDLLRPSRSMRRTPSPHRRRNYSVQVRRDPAEKQQILQQLVSAGSCSLDGESKPITPKPTLAEIIQMSEKRLRLASASSLQGDHGSNEPRQGEEETSFINNPTPGTSASMGLTPAAIKAEKKVTFARMLEKMANNELSSSDSDSDVSCAEDTKMVVVAPKPIPKKERKGRFRRSKAYRGRNSETDQDYMDISSSDTTPDPIYTPKLPTRLCISPTGLGGVGGSGSSSNMLGKPTAKIPKIASADSLLSLFRRFSGSNSAPPSPQFSENEESSTGATPLSTPSSPRSSLLSIRPPALLITSVPEPNNTIELPVIDPFGQGQGWRAPPSSSITLEVPMRDYCLSPIHEVPTPLASPCHSPMMKRCSMENLPTLRVQSSEDDGTGSASSASVSTARENRDHEDQKRKMSIPLISISVEDGDELEKAKQAEGESKPFPRHCMITGESEVIPDVLIHVPPDACVESQPESESPVGEVETPSSSPRVKCKPPPLVFANEILSSPSTKPTGDTDRVIVPLLHIEHATPVKDHMPKFPSIQLERSPFEKEAPETGANSKSAYEMHGCPLVPPVITINQSYEAESDSDPPVQRNLLHRPNICHFLSPFAGTSDRVPSESNLSTSGYSSMASPCPSRCPSVSPLCPSEAEDFHPCCHSHNQRRASLTPGTPKKPLLPFRRSSFNAPHTTSSLLCDKSGLCSEYGKLKEQAEVETDSAVEIETDVDCVVNQAEMSPSELLENSAEETHPLLSDEMQCINALLQVPKKGMPKSRSLDISMPGREGRSGCPDGRQLTQDGNKLRGLGPSLDSKLNYIDPGKTQAGVTIIFPLSASTSNLSGAGRKGSGNLIEIPEEKERRLSPVSSRSESPLSELSGAGCFGFPGSPLTDSDGVYDCGSSEVLTNANETDTGKGSRLSLQPHLSRVNPRRRSGGRKERKLTRNNNKFPSLSPVAVDAETGRNIQQATTDVASSEGPQEDSFMKQITHSRLDLPVSLARGLSSTVSPKRLSPKRRTRKSPVLRGSSSSSSESLNSRSARASWSSVQNSRNNSPLPSGQEQEGGNQAHSPGPLSPRGGSLEETLSSPTFLETEQKTSESTSLLQRVGTRPPEPGAGATVSRTTGRKISRLRTISHQIRFLRRLELSLLRKKESLKQTSSSKPLLEDSRENILTSTDSAEVSSRDDTSDTSCTCSSVSCSECCSCDCDSPDDETSLMHGRERQKGQKPKKRTNPRKLLDNISAKDFFSSRKRKT